MDALHERGVDYALLEADPFADVPQVLHDRARPSARVGNPRSGPED